MYFTIKQKTTYVTRRPSCDKTVSNLWTGHKEKRTWWSRNHPFTCHVFNSWLSKAATSFKCPNPQGRSTTTTSLLTCRDMSLICTSSVLHFPKSLMSGVSATAGAAVSHSVILGTEIVRAQAHPPLTSKPVHILWIRMLWGTKKAVKFWVHLFEPYRNHSAFGKMHLSLPQDPWGQELAGSASTAVAWTTAGQVMPVPLQGIPLEFKSRPCH